MNRVKVSLKSVCRQVFALHGIFADKVLLLMLTSSNHRAYLCITKQNNLPPAVFFQFLSITTKKEPLGSRVAEIRNWNNSSTADENKCFVL